MELVERRTDSAPLSLRLLMFACVSTHFHKRLLAAPIVVSAALLLAGCERGASGSASAQTLPTADAAANDSAKRVPDSLAA